MRKDKKKMLLLTSLRIFCALIGIIFMIWFLLPLKLSMGFDIGNITGLAVSIVLLLYGIFMPLCHKIIVWLYGRLWGKVLCFAALAAVLMIFILVIVETCCIISAASKEPEPGKTVVVLGCRVYGERPSRALHGRAMKACEYLKANPDSICILSGGMGADELISEAECMYRILVAEGINPERLIKEEKSTTTKENLQFSKEIIEANNLNSEIVVVTSEYHQYRAGWLAKKLGFTASGACSKSRIAALPTFYVRELYGILHQWLTE